MGDGIEAIGEAVAVSGICQMLGRGKAVLESINAVESNNVRR